MKLSLASLAILSIYTPNAEALCLKDALLTEGYWFDDATLGFDDGIPCTLGKAKKVFTRMMADLTGCGTMIEELRDVFGVQRGAAMKTILKEACDAAPDPSHDPTKSFRDILDLDFNTENGAISLDEAEDRFLKEFYDGNTFINQEVGNYNALQTKQNSIFGQIKSFDRNESKKKVVGWPSDDVDNFNECSMNTVMCCWVTDRKINNGDNNGDCKGPYPNRRGPGDSNCIDADPADNTDICYVDNERSPQANHVAGGFILYPDDVEDDAHCHGFIWANDEDSESNIYKANNLFYVSMEDHLRTRGYVRNVPGAPMCGCLEQMPTVSRSDCTQTTHKYFYDFSYTGNPDELFTAVVKSRKVSFNACDGDTANDLASKYAQMVENGEIDDLTDDFEEIVVGNDNCATKMDEFVRSNGFTK